MKMKVELQEKEFKRALLNFVSVYSDKAKISEIYRNLGDMNKDGSWKGDGIEFVVEVPEEVYAESPALPTPKSTSEPTPQETSQPQTSASTDLDDNIPF